MEEVEYLKKISECVWKPESECTDEERHTRLIERERCKQSFWYFFKYCKLVEAPTATNPGGIISFKMWAHVKKIIGVLLTALLISILKSRQIGASWIVAAFVLWCALFHQGDTSLLFSKGELEAVELLGKCKRVYKFLPDFFKLKMDPDSTTEIGFPIMMSSIKAMAATETAGISFTASRIICDEHIEHPYATANYLAAKPTIDAGGQFISIFTVNEDKLDSLAVSIFKDAIEGKNGFVPLFFPYDVRPGRDDQWYKDTAKSIPVNELSGLTPDIYMHRNYPKSVEEALSPVQTIAVFYFRVLDEMMGETKNPIHLFNSEIDEKIINVYQNYRLGEFYIAASDTSHGVGQDYSVTLILNVKTGAVVADIYKNIISEEEFAYHSVKLLKLFGSPLWFPEDNEWGRVIITEAQNLGYRNFGYQDKARTKPGFHSDDKTRRDLWGSLIPAVNSHQIQVFNSAALKTFYDVIRNSKKEGRIEASSGGHDDYPTALGIAWLHKDKVQTTNLEYKPIKTLTFARR